MNATVNYLNDVDTSRWDAFVRSVPGGLPTQLSAWQEVIAASYGHRCHFLMAQEAGQITGVLPLIEIRSILTGHSLQSLPGAVCAPTTTAGLALITAADDLARELKADYLLLRDSRQNWPGSNLECISAHKTIRRSLSTDPEVVRSTIHRNTRRYIRKAQQRDDLSVVLTVPVDPIQLKDFYTVFASFNHAAGTPPFGYSFLDNVVQAFPGTALVSVVYLDKTPIAGFFCLILESFILGTWGAALPANRDDHPTHLAYWAMIEYGCQAGFTELEFGRAPYPSGQYDFKATWGDQVFPVYQLYRVYRGKQPAVVQIGIPAKDTTGLSFFRQVWRRLPHRLALALGPKIRRHLPFG